MRRYYSLLANLVNRCRSCGSTLQAVDSSVAGFKPIVAHKPFVKKEDVVWNQFASKFDKDDAQLLNWDDAKDFAKEHKRLKETGATEENECMRCRDIIHRSEVVHEPIIENESILDKIGDGKIVYVANSIDFPSSIHRSILSKYKPIVVLTKMDLLYKIEADFKKYPFFKQYFGTNFGIPPENIFLTSHKKYWGFKNFYKFLTANPNTYYFVGDVNAGKSSLISRLIFRDKNINTKFVHWSAKYGPGISTLPGFTRDMNKFQISGCNLVDLPGLNGDKLIFDNWNDMKNLFKNISMVKKGLYNAHYETFRNNQILTIGGLFYLRMPETDGLVVQYKSLINHERLVFRDLDKLLNLKINESLRNRFLVKPNVDEMEKNGFPYKRFLIPPFYGKVDLVLKNFGYVELTPTGPKNTNKLFEVLVPNNIDIDIIVREPLHFYVSKVPTGKDKWGNPLKKENMNKSKKEAKKYNGDLLATRLIPWDGVDQFRTVSSFLTAVKGRQVEYNEDTEITSNNYKDYWFY